MKKVAQFFLVACLFIFVACSDSQNSESSTLKMAYSKNVGPLNPQDYGDNAMFAQGVVFEGLFKVAENGQILPHLATGFDSSYKDGKAVYTFYLRENVSFSNGEKFDSYAVWKNFQAILKSTRHSWSALAQLLESVEICGDFCIEFTLSNFYGAILNELATIRPYRFIAPSQIDEDFKIKKDFKPIGTGAYVLESSKLGIEDVFVKNALYWDKSAFAKNSFEKIIIKVIPNPHASIAALKSNQIDLIYGYDELPFEVFSQVLDSQNLDSEISESSNSESSARIKAYISQESFLITHLVLNSVKIDSETRKRILQNIQRNKMIELVYGDLQKCEHRIFISQPAKNCDENVAASHESQPKDSQQKKAFKIMFDSQSVSERLMAQILQQQLANEFDISLESYEPSIFKNRSRNGEFDITFSQTWGVPYEPLIMLHSMLAPAHLDYAAQLGWENRDEFAKLVKRLISESSDLKAQTKELERLYELLESSDIYYPLVSQKNKALAREFVGGIVDENGKWQHYGLEMDFKKLYKK